MIPKEPWTIKREVSLGDMVSIVIAVVSVVVAYMTLNARVMVVEAVTAQNSADMRSTMSEIKGELRRLNERIEKLVDTRK